MKDFFDKIDRKKIFVIVIYIIISIFVIIMIPKLLNFTPSVSNNKGAIVSTNNPYNSFITSSAGGFLTKFLQFATAIILIIIPIVVFNKNGLAKSNAKKYGTQGTAELGQLKELEGLTVSINCKKGEGGYTLSKNIRLSLAKSFEHVAIIGPTGAGKSTSFFIPTLLDMDGTVSVVVTDPKGELCKITGPYLQSMGMDIIKLVPLNPEENKYYYNPLLLAEDDSQINQIAQLILINGGKSIELATGSSGGGQSDWINMAVPYFTATLMYVKKFGKKKSINEAIEMILDTGCEAKDLEELEKKYSLDKKALKYFQIFKSSGGSEKTMSSIKSVLTSNIQVFLDDNVEKFTKTPFNMNSNTGKLEIDNNRLFRPTALRERPTALFVCVPEIKSDFMMPLMSVFYNQLLDLTMTHFNDTDNKVPILYMLDEFANIGVIPIISKVTATARSRKIGVSLGLQGVEQLKRNYGEENANDILNNLKSKVIFSGLTGDSAKYVSGLAGVTTVETISIGDNNSGQNIVDNIFNSKNITKSGTQRQLFQEDEIRRLDDNEVLIIAHNRNVVKDKKNTYYTQQRYTKKLKKE